MWSRPHLPSLAVKPVPTWLRRPSVPRPSCRRPRGRSRPQPPLVARQPGIRAVPRARSMDATSYPTCHALPTRHDDRDSNSVSAESGCCLHLVEALHQLDQKWAWPVRMPRCITLPRCKRITSLFNFKPTFLTFVIQSSFLP